MITVVLLTSEQRYCCEVMQTSLQMLRVVKTEDQERATTRQQQLKNPEQANS
jgi:hypothetical protein